VESLLDQLRALQSSATSTEAFTYWGYHIARTLFFTVQGAAGLVYSRGGMARNPFTQARVGNTGNQVSSESTLTADGGEPRNRSTRRSASRPSRASLPRRSRHTALT